MMMMDVCLVVVSACRWSSSQARVVRVSTSVAPSQDSQIFCRTRVGFGVRHLHSTLSSQLLSLAHHERYKPSRL